MMPKHIAIIVGHPDPGGKHYEHALVEAYKKGAEAAGHDVELIEVGRMTFPLLRTKEDYEKDVAPATIQEAQRTLSRADHWVIFYPMWLGAMPAVLKGFLEQVLRPGFAFRVEATGNAPKKLLAGKSARVVVTMGMPAFFYRWYFGAHGLKNLKRNILGFCGVGPIRDSLIGMIESSDARRKKWLRKMEALGHAGA